jgi:hypothetical protein
MKTVDEVRGLEREILFSSTGGYATGGGLPLTNCVIEVKRHDGQWGNNPMLSLRFYHKPDYPHQIAQESAEAGRPLYDDNTPIGVEINLGLEIAHSLIEQMQTQWPEFIRVLQDVDE